MLEIYREVFLDLWHYREFQVAFELFHYSLLLLLGFLLFVIMLHLAYMLGYNSLLYKKRSPRVGWSRRFLGASFLLLGFICILYAAMDQLIK